MPNSSYDPIKPHARKSSPIGEKNSEPQIWTRHFFASKLAHIKMMMGAKMGEVNSWLNHFWLADLLSTSEWCLLFLQKGYFLIDFFYISILGKEIFLLFWLIPYQIVDLCSEFAHWKDIWEWINARLDWDHLRKSFPWLITFFSPLLKWHQQTFNL